MVDAKDEVSKLFWKGQHIGNIVGVGWSDFPWRAGDFIEVQLSEEARTVIEWFASMADAEELEDPPFGEEELNSWWIETPAGERVDLETAPLIDLKEGTIEWR